MPAFKKRLNKSKAECLWVCVHVYVSCFNYYKIYFSAVIINLYRFVFIFTLCSKQIEFEYDEFCNMTKVAITMIWSNIANILVFLVCCLYAHNFFLVAPCLLCVWTSGLFFGLYFCHIWICLPPLPSCVQLSGLKIWIFGCPACGSCSFMIIVINCLLLKSYKIITNIKNINKQQSQLVTF